MVKKEKKMPAAFIDKDGTLVDNSNYKKEIPKDKLMEDKVVEGLFLLQRIGYKIIIISNQPWVSRGDLSEGEVEAIFENISEKLKKRGIKIDDYLYCPHRNEDNCSCKKPRTGLICEAVRRNNIDIRKSLVIGDRNSDIKLAKNIGIRSLFVLTGAQKEDLTERPDHIIPEINKIRREIWFKI